jgi:hypothetical protein
VTEALVHLYAPVITVLAQADPAGLYGALLQFGGVGILAAAALWWARSLYSREVKSYDRLEEEHRKLQASIRDEYVKTIVAATQAITSAMELIAEIRKERR